MVAETDKEEANIKNVNYPGNNKLLTYNYLGIFLVDWPGPL